MIKPFALIDARAPKEAIEALQKIISTIPFLTQGLTYAAISGHPDVFFAKINQEWIIAPNTPQKYIDHFTAHEIPFELGEEEIGESLSESTYYNVLFHQHTLYHKVGFTSKTILEKTAALPFTALPQAYTRCSVFGVGEHLITSDSGIAKVLKQRQLSHCLVPPQQILLPPYPYGFIGGTMGFWQGTLYFIGDPRHHECFRPLLAYLKKHDIQWQALYNGPLYDGGGILFVG